MSDATHTPRALLAERFGEDIVPFDLTDTASTEGGRRARFIAVLHALIAWFGEHPDAPVPTFVRFHAYVPAEQIEQLAAAFGVKAYGTERPQIDLELLPFNQDPSADFLIAATSSADRRPL
jgi:hypothetical protein